MEKKKRSFYERIAQKERSGGVKYTEDFKEKLYIAR